MIRHSEGETRLMRDISAEISAFLTFIDMHPAQTDVDVFVKAFLAEMDAGLAGGSSSLKMIPSYVSADGTPEDGVPVIAIDAGGTNLRVALVEFQNGRPVVLREQESPVPGSRGEVSAEAFFAELADDVLPFTQESDRIGFCFSYPAVIFPDGDGQVICLTKEVRVSGIEGRMIGRSLLRKLGEKGVKKDFTLTILNDTTASLLGGMAAPGLDPKGGVAGLILGTGCNTCYAERGERIKKLHGAGNMIVNCESGNFSRAFRGRADEMVDASSENPGAYRFEKMLSGVYLGRVVTCEAQLAAKEGLLSAAFRDIGAPFTAPELDDFLRGGENRAAALCRGTDREALARLIDLSFARAGKLICANVLALCLHCDGGKTAAYPFSVVAEGSTFYKSLLLRDKLGGYMKSVAQEAYGRRIAFYRAERATLNGAAFAALNGKKRAVYI